MPILPPYIEQYSLVPRPESSGVKWKGWAILASFLLVIAARVLLIVGVIQSGGLAWIYVSIGASATAAVLLFVAVRRARR